MGKKNKLISSSKPPERLILPRPSIQFLNGKPGTTTHLILLPQNVNPSTVQPISLSNLSTVGNVTLKPVEKSPKKDIPAKAVNKVQILSTPEKNNSVPLKSGNKKFTNAGQYQKITSEESKVFLETMLKSKVVDLLGNSGNKKAFFIEVYRELEKKGYPLNSKSPEEGGLRVWQKWRNFEKEYTKKTITLKQVESKAKNNNGETVLHYPHYNFVLIKMVRDHLQKNSYTPRKPTKKIIIGEVKVDQQEQNEEVSNADNDSCDSVQLIDSDIIYNEEHNLSSINQLVHKTLEEEDTIKNEITKDNINNNSGETIDADPEYNEELLQEFECQMYVEEDVSRDNTIMENISHNDHEYVQTRKSVTRSQNKDTVIKLEDPFVTNHNEHNISPCCKEIHNSLNNMFEKYLNKQNELLEQMKHVINEQTNIIKEQNLEKIKTNKLLEKLILHFDKV